MDVKKIKEDKKRYLDLLLLGDEQESMIDRYLDAGEMFALYDGGVKTICVVNKLSDSVYEIKNLATKEEYQNMGYAKQMLEFIFKSYKGRCEKIIVGTGDVASAIGFYSKFGFKKSFKVENFFIDNYDHPIFEDGRQLRDMQYLEKLL